MEPAVDGDGLAGHGLRLVAAHAADPAEILRFELEHRAFFRRWIPDRGDGYYSADGVAASLLDARRWWEAGSDYLHVVVDAERRIVARANLVDVRDGRADLGYRVAETHLGRGIARAAVRDLLARAPHWGIQAVYAVTSVDNVGSGRVLERVGFHLLGRRPGALQMGETAHDALDWVRRRPLTVGD